MRRRMMSLGAAVLVAMLLGAVAVPGSDGESGPAVSAATGQAGGAGQPDRLVDWIYHVGRDIEPGVFEATMPQRQRFHCYWARLRSFGMPDSIIADGHLDPGETARVTVRPSDRGFKVSNGCVWRPVG